MKLAFDVRKNVRPALIAGVVILAINTGVYALVIRPRVQAYVNLEGTRMEFDRELASAEKTHKKLSEKFAKIQATEQNDEKFHKAILGTKQARSIDIQREISDIATEFQIDPQSVSIHNRDLEESGLESFEIDLPLEGDYGNLRNFIARVENSQSFLIVDSIGLSGTKEGGLQLALNINVSTFFDAPWLKSLKKPDRSSRRRS